MGLRLLGTLWWLRLRRRGRSLERRDRDLLGLELRRLDVDLDLGELGDLLGLLLEGLGLQRGKGYVLLLGLWLGLGLRLCLGLGRREGHLVRGLLDSGQWLLNLSGGLLRSWDRHLGKLKLGLLDALLGLLRLLRLLRLKLSALMQGCDRRIMRRWWLKLERHQRRLLLLRL